MNALIYKQYIIVDFAVLGFCIFISFFNTSYSQNLFLMDLVGTLLASYGVLDDIVGFTCSVPANW